MTYLERGFLNIYLHNSILQLCVGSNLGLLNFQTKYNKNILKIFQIKQLFKQASLALYIIMFAPIVILIFIIR
jgi:hypothetical protein